MCDDEKTLLNPKNGEDELTKIIKHMIGLDNSKPYYRQGKAFYNVYRNYFCENPQGNPILDGLPSDYIHKEVMEHYVYYKLTRQGFEWASDMLGIQIKV